MSDREIQALFDKLWEPYYRQNPQVPQIYRLLTAREKTDTLYNDHIALRTFGHERINLEVLSRAFTTLGFSEQDQFELTDKHVFAKYYRHPSDQWPRVFISELDLGCLSKSSLELIYGLVAQIPQTLIDSGGLCYRGRPWQVSHFSYEELRKESEYAAWMAAHGFQMNHATVSVNAMESFETLEQLTAFLQEHGFKLNGEGERAIIKTAHDAHQRVVLKQASTIASLVSVDFLDGTFQVPGCYYEFLQRFHGYDSFDPANATKIMESTYAR